MRLRTAVIVSCQMIIGSYGTFLRGEPIRMQSSEDQSILLELYTSEGCSSCPPAERWLSGLKDNPRLWRDLVPVAFHVDYWDSLGWKDRFGSKAFSERQRGYAEDWRTQSVYTPGFIVNGQEWKGWFKREALPAAPQRKVGILRAHSSDRSTWTLEFQPSGTVDVPWCEFHAALLGFNLVNQIKAGENQGRRLEHDFAVLRLAKARPRREHGGFLATLRLAPESPVAKRLAVAVWVTLPERLEPLQAVGSWIPAE
jgi:hypothetical protein